MMNEFILSAIATPFRWFAYTLFRRSSIPQKKFQIRVVGRGIVAEFPKDFPFHIADDDGNRFNGVYIIGLRAWDSGSRAVHGSDIIQSYPIQIEIESPAEIVTTSVISPPDGPVCEIRNNGKRAIEISFDAFNPKDHVEIGLFITGNPRTAVKVSGKVLDQESSIDRTGDEGKAEIGERIASGIILFSLAATVIGSTISLWMLWQAGKLGILFTNPDEISRWMLLPLTLGATVLGMFISARVARWFERKKHPPGVPLYSDLEPPLLDNLRGMWLMCVNGKKVRVSTSIFDWGKPIIVTHRPLKARSIDDWVVR